MGRLMKGDGHGAKVEESMGGQVFAWVMAIDGGTFAAPQEMVMVLVQQEEEHHSSGVCCRMRH